MTKPLPHAPGRGWKRGTPRSLPAPVVHRVSVRMTELDVDVVRFIRRRWECASDSEVFRRAVQVVRELLRRVDAADLPEFLQTGIVPSEGE